MKKPKTKAGRILRSIITNPLIAQIIPGGNILKNIMDDNSEPVGKIDTTIAGKNLVIDLGEIALIVIVLAYAFGWIDSDTAEGAKQLLEN